MVDEFQDTTLSQWKIVKLLLGSSGKITVVGDIDQSIYSFRGSTIVNLGHFDSLFKTKEEKEKGFVILNQNYRSTKQVRRSFQSLTCEIVIASSKLIVNNLNRPTADDLWTENEEGSAPMVVCSVNSKNEITCILDLIQEKKEELKLRYCEIAILYRNRATGRLFESELHKRF